MRFSLRTLMLSALLVAIPGSVATYNAIWHAHCRRMEPSLFRHILEHDLAPSPALDPVEFEHDGETHRWDPNSGESGETTLIYFGFSRAGSDALVPPSKSLIDQIGISEIRALKDTEDGECLFYIKIVEWIDWETVIVDYGSVFGPLSGGGANGVELKHTDGKWEIIDVESDWISKALPDLPDTNTLNRSFVLRGMGWII